MNPVSVRPELITWARERAAGLEQPGLMKRFSKLMEWEKGGSNPLYASSRILRARCMWV